MRRISIERALRSAQGFARAEWRLALPIALAFLALPWLIVSLAFASTFAVMPRTIAEMQAASMALPGWWTPVLVLTLLFSALGSLALMTLALVPRISVREALTLAARRFPFWLGAALLLFAGIFVVLMIVMILVGVLRGGDMLAVAITFLAMLAGMLFASLLLPILADRPLAPIALLREGGRLYRASWGRISAGLLLYLAMAWVVMMALQVSFGSILLIAGRLLGSPEIGGVLAALLASVISSIAWSGFALLLAGVYRQASA